MLVAAVLAHKRRPVEAVELRDGVLEAPRVGDAVRVAAVDVAEVVDPRRHMQLAPRRLVCGAVSGVFNGGKASAPAGIPCEIFLEQISIKKDAPKR